MVKQDTYSFKAIKFDFISHGQLTDTINLFRKY